MRVEVSVFNRFRIFSSVISVRLMIPVYATTVR